MALIAHDGPGTYRSTNGGSLVITSTQRLLGLRVIANGTSGNFTLNNAWTTAGEPVSVTTVYAFDWNPSYFVTNTTLTFSSTTLEWFAELGLNPATT